MNPTSTAPTNEAHVADQAAIWLDANTDPYWANKTMAEQVCHLYGRHAEWLLKPKYCESVGESFAWALVVCVFVWAFIKPL